MSIRGSYDGQDKSNWGGIRSMKSRKQDGAAYSKCIHLCTKGGGDDQRGGGAPLLSLKK